MTYVERLVINNESKSTILYDEHIIRYQFVAPLTAGKQVLDIACGSGYGAAFLANNGAKSVLGMDIDEAAIAEDKKNYSQENLEFRVGDATKIDLTTESFDVVTSFETIEHLPEIEAYLAEIKRAVKHDGLVFISTPNKTIFKQTNPWHLKEFTREEFETLLKKFFPFVKIIEQKNALSSVIKVNDKAEGTVLFNDQTKEALYFIAVCSQREITETFTNVSSANTIAYERWENNPGWKMVNAIYRVLQKLKIK
ncbi:MAG: class I SAM-dependent methyltransferase [Candidatus Falkowbacteria bacterium]|nr:class I SAM-dependent methyltransferase [Candidatus Falkowbacteria bacterium]